jgi:hypothetical protein
MEAFCEAQSQKWHKQELHVHIKEMHGHMREAELKEEEEEELQQWEALKKWEEELVLREQELEKQKNVIRLFIACSGWWSSLYMSYFIALWAI